MPQLTSGEIQRKENVPEQFQTEQRKRVADYIQNEIVNKGRWPQTKQEMSEELETSDVAKDEYEITATSRQHIANVLNQYFEPADSQVDRTNHSERFEIEIPPDVDKRSYLRGYFHREFSE